MAYSQQVAQQAVMVMSDMNKTNLNRDDMIAELSACIDISNQLFEFESMNVTDNADTQKLVNYFQMMSGVRDGLIRFRNKLFENESETITDSQKDDFIALANKFSKAMAHLNNDMLAPLQRANGQEYQQYIDAIKEVG